MVQHQSELSSSRLHNDSIHRKMEEKQSRPVVMHMKGSRSSGLHTCFEV